MKPDFLETQQLEGVVVRFPTPYPDARGSLVEFFRMDEISAELSPAMGYLSTTFPGISRGPHEHREQTDLFFFPGFGTFLVALWDNRKHLPSFGQRMLIATASDQPCVIIIPPGVVHAYHCTSKVPGIVINVPNQLYAGKNKQSPVDEIRHEKDAQSPYVIDFTRCIERHAS